MVYILKSLVQKFIIDLRTSIVSPKAAHGYQICRNHGVPSVPSLCQSTMLALLVSTFTASEDLSPQGWLREGEVDKSEVWNTSVQDITRILESIQSTPFPHQPHSCKIASRLQRIILAITAALEVPEIPEGTLSYMAQQRAKVGELTFLIP